MAIVKLVLVLVSAFAQQHAFTAPNARPPTEHLHEKRGLEYIIPHFAALVRILSWIWATFETTALVTLSDYCPSILADPIRHVLAASNPSTLTALTPTFLAGTCLMLAGGLLRAHCFHTLGPRFTFELSIRPAHALMTTGVYGVVRHPSYTAIAVLSVGWVVCLLDLRAWAVDACMAHVASWDDDMCDVVVTGALGGAWATSLGTIYVIVSERMDKEDVMLENNFGEEWRTWARKVPYRLLPGVY